MELGTDQKVDMGAFSGMPEDFHIFKEMLVVRMYLSLKLTKL
jgi:hypothetical protein